MPTQAHVFLAQPLAAIILVWATNPLLVKRACLCVGILAQGTGRGTFAQERAILASTTLCNAMPLKAWHLTCFSSGAAADPLLKRFSVNALATEYKDARHDAVSAPVYTGSRQRESYEALKMYVFKANAPGGIHGAFKLSYPSPH